MQAYVHQLAVCCCSHIRFHAYLASPVMKPCPALIWQVQSMLCFCCTLFPCAAASENRVVAKLQVFLAWHQAQQEVASQQILKQLQQTHLAEQHHRKVFSRHSLRAWQKGTATSKEESAAQIRREQTWTKVQGWLAENNLSTGSTVCSGTNVQVACIDLAWCCRCVGSATMIGHKLTTHCGLH